MKLKIDQNLRALIYERALRRFRKIDLFDEKFEKQNDFLKDQNKFISVCCSRRAGKSYGIAKKLLFVAQKVDQCIIPYISLTKKAANNIMFPIFYELNETYKLNLVLKHHKSEVICPNGSIIHFHGADSSGLAERLRGAKYPIVAIDEAQSYKIDLQNLVFDVLSPAVADYSKIGYGQIVLVGTPGRSPTGFFYNTLFESKMKFSKHSWTLFDNPYFPDPQTFLNNLLVAKGVTIDNPTIQRELFSRWVKDDTCLVYHLTPKNIIEKYDFKIEKNIFVLGVDLGFNPDPTAFTLVTYNFKDGFLVVLKSYSINNLTVTDVINEINKYIGKYKYIKVVADLGALGKMIGEEIKKRSNIPIEAVKKGAKFSFINLLNDDLRNNRIKIIKDECEELIDELSNIQLDGSEIEKREDPRMKNDCADSFLYAWRYCYHYIIEENKQKQEEDLIEEELEKKMIDSSYNN